MDKEQFRRTHQKKQLIWDSTWIGIMIICVVAGEIMVWNQPSPEKFLMMFFMPFLIVGTTLAVVGPIDRHLRRTVLKEYWVEDHGEVVKLFGAVRVVDMHYAYREILRVKPGLKIIEDAHKKYGCTIAAIQATDADLKAKEEVESLGFKVRTIG